MSSHSCSNEVELKLSLFYDGINGAYNYICSKIFLSKSMNHWWLNRLSMLVAPSLSEGFTLKISNKKSLAYSEQVKRSNLSQIDLIVVSDLKN